MFRVLHILSGDLWGGAEAQMGLQIAAQREEGIDAEVLLFNVGETAKRYAELSIPTYQLDESNGFLQLVREASSVVDNFKPRIIVTHGYKEAFLATVLKIRKKTPFLTTFHGWSEAYSGIKRIKMECYAALYLFISRNFAAGRITVTDALAEQLNLSAVTIHNVSEPVPELLTAVSSRSNAFDDSRPKILFAGRLVPVKRLDLAISAMSFLVRNFEKSDAPLLYVAGEGPLRAQLEQYVEQLKLKDSVRFLGFRSDVSHLIESSDVILLTSESEGLPTILLEAMNHGRPAVLPDLRGIREILEEFEGYPALLVNTQDSRGYADALLEILNPMKRTSPELVEKAKVYFHPKRAAREAIELYKSVVEG